MYAPLHNLHCFFSTEVTRAGVCLATATQTHMKTIQSSLREGAGAEETTVNPCYPLGHLQEKLARRLLGLQHTGLQKEMDNLIIKRGILLKMLKMN